MIPPRTELLPNLDWFAIFKSYDRMIWIVILDCCCLYKKSGEMVEYPFASLFCGWRSVVTCVYIIWSILRYKRGGANAGLLARKVP